MPLADDTTASADADNACRWDRAARGHYEVWFALANHLPSRTGYWIRYTLEAPLAGEPYAQLWFARFHAGRPDATFGIHRTFPAADLATADAPFSCAIGDAAITSRSARGALSGAGHDARWDLCWQPATRAHRTLPDLMYLRGGLGETTVLAPSLDASMSGTIEVDGETFELSRAPGCQFHLWGKKHAHEWAWGHCAQFGARHGAALELLTVRLRRAGRVLPPLTLLTLYLDGDVHRFNQFRHVGLTRAEYGTGFYRFRARGARVRIDGEFTCRPEQMVMTPYVDPDGDPSFCANTEIADLRVTVYERAGLGWRERARLVAPGTAHFEVATRERDPRIPNLHRLV